MKGFACPYCREATALLFIAVIVVLAVLVGVVAAAYSRQKRDDESEPSLCLITDLIVGVAECEFRDFSDGKFGYYNCFSLGWSVRAPFSQPWATSVLIARTKVTYPLTNGTLVKGLIVDSRNYAEVGSAEIALNRTEKQVLDLLVCDLLTICMQPAKEFQCFYKRRDPTAVSWSVFEPSYSGVVVLSALLGTTILVFAFYAWEAFYKRNPLWLDEYG
jgi:hypothetical protein